MVNCLLTGRGAGGFETDITLATELAVGAWGGGGTATTLATEAGLNSVGRSACPSAPLPSCPFAPSNPSTPQGIGSPRGKGHQILCPSTNYPPFLRLQQPPDTHCCKNTAVPAPFPHRHRDGRFPPPLSSSSMQRLSKRSWVFNKKWPVLKQTP